MEIGIVVSVSSNNTIINKMSRNIENGQHLVNQNGDVWTVVKINWIKNDRSGISCNAELRNLQGKLPTPNDTLSVFVSDGHGRTVSYEPILKLKHVIKFGKTVILVVTGLTQINEGDVIKGNNNEWEVINVGVISPANEDQAIVIENREIENLKPGIELLVFSPNIS